MCICTDLIWPKVADTIQNGIPPNVLAVTKTRGPGKWREGALSLVKITFKAQKGVHADGVLQHRSGPLFSLQPQPSEWNGSGVGESHRRTSFICMCVACSRRINYLWTTLRVATAHTWSSRSEQIFMAEVWLILHYTEVTRRSSWPHGDASASVDFHINILGAPSVLIYGSSSCLYSEFIGYRWPPTVKTKHAAC